ncbi:ROK family protein [Deinococcus cellulosilyticus]|uniref:Sugar kinase n=1 Tax=Deinococcus cellulosilyticus (strain DSM 18568 / NBRC 106333 / KACC 11606 / 5516J-15) TaxID=1223518 RepID=A0A511MV14_DEIC1|nr:ROK family protein [Deinococcus cellulosilyticus]GEM44430.1 sugar kinase [Deinococcus cellulosilyticus NBRC 106333 = KACC 11606]
MLESFQLPATTLLGEETEVLAPLLWQGAQTRQQLAFAIRHSRSKLGQLLDGLLHAGWVEEMGQRDSVGGRKAALYGLNPACGHHLGVELSSREVRVVLADAALNILEVQTEPTLLTQGPGVVMARIRQIMDGLLKTHHISQDQVLGLSMGVPSPVEKPSGLLVGPNLMPGWEGFSVRDDFSHHYNIPVHVDNTTNLMALGELWHARRQGEGPQFESFLVLNLSSTFGAGMVIAGQLYRGSSGGAGEIAHMPLDPEGPRCHCGQQGCLERMAGAQALLEQATEAGTQGKSRYLHHLLSQQGSLSLQDLTRAAGAGDAEASRIIHSAGLKIGQVLAGLTNMLCPSHILVGGELAHIGPLMLAGIRQSVYGRAMPLATRKLNVDYTRLGKHSGLRGSLVHSILCHWGLQGG